MLALCEPRSYSIVSGEESGEADQVVLSSQRNVRTADRFECMHSQTAVEKLDRLKTLRGPSKTTARMEGTADKISLVARSPKQGMHEALELSSDFVSGAASTSVDYILAESGVHLDCCNCYANNLEKTGCFRPCGGINESARENLWLLQYSRFVGHVLGVLG